MVLLLVLAPNADASKFSVTSLKVDVYADGSAIVSQTASVNSSAVSIDLQLLSPILTDAIAVDQNGSPLSFQISGSNITIYTVGATGVTLRYDTDALTGKQGTVWDLNFSTGYNTTVTLPEGSTVTSISGTPYSDTEVGSYPVIMIGQGDWQIDYGVPIATNYTTTSSPGLSSTSQTSDTTASGVSSSSVASSGSNSETGSHTSTSSASSSTVSTGSSSVTVGSAFPFTYAAAGALVVGVLVLGAVVILRRGKTSDVGSPDLRPDDIQVLNFLAERGGKVFEPEIRTKFILPKTSAWRQIKRLERLGYVRISKVGSQNQVELIRRP
jgi:uncharacterized membrane protein